MQMQCASMTELVMMDETIPSMYSNDSSRNSEWLLSLHQLKIGIGGTHCMCRFLLHANEAVHVHWLCIGVTDFPVIMHVAVKYSPYHGISIYG